MEKYRLYHNRNVKPRNRAENTIVELAKIALANPTGLTIEQVREMIVLNQNSLPKSWGKVEVSEIHSAGRIMGKEHIMQRGFTIYGRGRGTYTLSINESIFKDSTNGFKLVDSVLNG